MAEPALALNRGGAADAAIPEKLNLLLLAGAATASSALLWAASHTTSLPLMFLCAVFFSFTNNTLFSLLHEAVHGIFSPRRGVNEWAGRLAAAFFPTGFGIQRAFHFTHHRNNRSPAEQFDIVHEGDVGWLKNAQWYSLLTGVYWAVAVFGVLTYLVVPKVLRLRLLRARESKVAEQTSSNEYLAALENLDPVAARVEILFALLFQIALFLLLDLSFAGWLLCYAAFALTWSALQYADHAFSPLDRHEGAWNLEVGRINRAFFLNYHYHRAHHQNPSVPWSRLPELVDPAEPRPSYWRIWREMWKGPRPEGAAPPLDRIFPPPPEERFFARLRVDLLCLREMARFGGRHPRYWLIAIALLATSLGRWRRRRVLRTGFTFLQLVDDLLDGDRPSEVEPLESTRAVAARIAVRAAGQKTAPPNGPLETLADAFTADLQKAGGREAIDLALELIAVMQADRRRVLERARLSQEELRGQLRQTFSLSVDLMLIAADAELRAADAPELIEAFGWCSVCRDLREDLAAGLVNVPREVLEEAGFGKAEKLEHDALVATPAMRRWMREEHQRAGRLLAQTETRLQELELRRGHKILRLFARSIDGFARRRFPRRYPELAS